MWADLFRRRMRPQVALWSVAALLAVLASRAAQGVIGSVVLAIIFGGVLGTLVPWLSSWTTSRDLRNGIVALGWHRRRFSTEADRLLGVGDIDGAGRAISSLAPVAPWERFEEERLKSRLAFAAGSPIAVTPEVRTAAAALSGHDRVRADAEIIIMESLQTARARGDWLHAVAAVGPAVRDDRDYGRRTRLHYLSLVAVFSSLVVAAVSGGVAVVLAVAGLTQR